MLKLVLFSLVGFGVGAGIGTGGGMILFPPEDIAVTEEEAVVPEEEVVENVAYANFADQFIIPVMNDDEIESLMILSIAIEVDADYLQDVYDREPKLRAEFLQSLFNHANLGGFSGNFTQFSPMASLRRELFMIAQNEAGSAVQDVLILDAVRQD